MNKELVLFERRKLKRFKHKAISIIFNIIKSPDYALSFQMKYSRPFSVMIIYKLGFCLGKYKVALRISNTFTNLGYEK